EHDTPSLQDNVARSVEFFNRAMRAPIADLTKGKVVPPLFTANVDDLWSGNRGQDSKKWPRPQALVKPDFSNADISNAAWTWQDNLLVAKNAGDLWTQDSYGDFVLTLEFRCTEKAEGDILLRGNPANPALGPIAVHILQGDDPDQKHVVGAILDVAAPTRQISINPGEWYRYVITAKGNLLSVMLNGEEVVKANLDDWKEAHKNPDGTQNSSDRPYKDLPREGQIGFRSKGAQIELRHVLIEKM
ncbi:MAG TPA: DUF1080 domain-containing protein, partial [Opitutaceae bacterium]|nr:DUF1080 domain-containing protein [Opitutaceae bacterium]